MGIERIVLRDTASRDDVDDARLRHGWRLANIVAARSGVPAQQVLLTGDRRHVLHFVEDALLDIRYVVVSGPDVPATRRLLEGALPTVGEDELARRLREGDGRALVIAALTLGDARPDVLQAFDFAFIDRSEAVRSSALVAAAYARWPALRPRVARVAGTDPAPRLREQAILILDAWPS